MSIQIECINVIIPIPLLWKCPAIGNVQQFLAEQAYSGSRCWHDTYLYRDGAMNPMDIESIVSSWGKAGLRLKRRRGGVEEWCDLCVVDTFSGPTLPCRWIEYDPESLTVSVKVRGLKECLDGFGS